MFETLTDRFDEIFTRLRGRGRISEADLTEALREIRVALLEGDVNLEVVRELVETIRTRAAGAELERSLTPAQQVIKIVNEELTAILGGEELRLTYAARPPTIVLLAGLQGSGKTSAAAKLAGWFVEQGRHPLLVAADLQRPAAVEQLRLLGRQVGAAVFSEPTDPVDVARRGVAEAVPVGRDVVVIDTAGRRPVDAVLMDEVRRRCPVDLAALHVPRRRRDDGPGRRRDGGGIPRGAHARRRDPHQARRRRPRRRRAPVAKILGRPVAFVSTGERPADFEVFRPGPDGGPDPRHGGRAVAHRARRAKPRPGPGRARRRTGSGAAGSRSTTFWTSWRR